MKWVDKHEPKNFGEMAGQRDNLTRIEALILSGDIPHFLFHGAPGTGKTLTAKIIASMLGADNGNFIEINASDDRSISEMRKKVIRAIRNESVSGGIKVIFLDEADGLLGDAQDILKTPMQKSKDLFILACNDITQVIKPIISRCTVFEFKELTDGDIVEGLKRIVRIEGVNITEATMREIAKKSQGDMRAAIGELQKEAAVNNRNTEIDRIVEQYMRQNNKAGAIA